MFLTSLKQTCNEYLIKFSGNQSAPKLENRKTSPCSPCAPNLLHVLVSRILGYHNLCSPGKWYYGFEHEPVRSKNIRYIIFVLSDNASNQTFYSEKKSRSYEYENILQNCHCLMACFNNTFLMTYTTSMYVREPFIYVLAEFVR